MRVTIARVPALAHYVDSVSLRTTKAQDELHKVVQEHPDGEMSSVPTKVQFLAWLVSTLNAKKVLEVGVFLGAATLGIAQALPEGGNILALDISEEFTSVGVKYWKEAGVDNKINLQLKPAVDTLTALLDNTAEVGTYDFAFIDADKANYDQYYELCLKMLRVGGVVAIDNTLWDGNVINEEDKSADTIAIRNLNLKIHKDSRVDISMLCIADGLTLCRKL